MAKLHDAAGPTRDNMASFYQSGERPQAVQDTETRELRPVEPTTGLPLEPKVQPGYYPGYHTLSQQAFWDAATREVILHRVNNVPPIRFFTPEEARLMQAVVDRVLPQDDRTAATRIPILNHIDKRLYEHVSDGYRFEAMPPDEEAFRLGIKGIQAIAQQEFEANFENLKPGDQDMILLSLHDGQPKAGDEYWKQMSVLHFWQLLVQDCVQGYYAHPYAWDEIGYGGPAYPRGYMRLLNGEPEPWEVPEKRYQWSPPPTALSGMFSPLGRGAGPSTPTPGQGGTH